eukprot:Seg1802.1 transcript_id=Seg1802.1/GoldUCD/mRNA.D3Y31 product="hypothetical protein" protein_id=Seg1802.1/GoldUCD/D3Y31
MDSGHGLVDRILMAIPPAFRPLPEEEAECRQWLMEANFNCISSIYRHVISLHENDTTYYFEDQAEQAIKAINYEHIIQINEALKNGECTPQSKKSDLIPRVAVGIHVLQHIAVALLNGDAVQPIPQGIQEPTVKKALNYVNYLESQKEVFLADKDLCHRLFLFFVNFVESVILEAVQNKSLISRKACWSLYSF